MVKVRTSEVRQKLLSTSAGSCGDKYLKKKKCTNFITAMNLGKCKMA